MPHYNIGHLIGYEHFLASESAKNKLNFLMKTLYNRKQIKKTLDLRKLNEIKSKISKVWDQQTEKIIKQKINIRRLKLRVKNRFLQARKINAVVRPH